MTEESFRHKKLSRVLAIIALAAWLMLLRPFPITTFLAACVSCVLYPWYQKLTKRFDGIWPTAIYAATLACATALPIIIVLLLVAPQAVNGLLILDKIMESDWFSRPETQAMLTSIDGWMKDIPGLEGGLRQLAAHMAGIAGTAARTVLTGSLGLAGSALNALFVLLLFVMISVMCVVQGPIIREFAQRLSNFPEDMLSRFILAIRSAVRGVMMGIVLVAMIQGLLSGIGFRVAGVPQPAFWGLLATFVAPIPFVGTALVWLPAVIWLWFAVGKTASIGLLLWCVLAVTSVDNVLRPMFLKTGINATFVALILSILLGLSAFGPVGIFAGPVAIAIAIQASVESTASEASSRRCDH